MVIERKFIRDNIKLAQIHKFLADEFTKAGFSRAEVSRTPVATRITVWAQKPGMVIGRGGKTIDALTETLKIKFGLENPQLEVQEVENPDLDASIVARQIAAAVERGLQYKRVVQLTMQRVMEAGAIGVSIMIGGKLGGEVSRREKFSMGYLKYAGEPAQKLSRAYATATVKLGIIGVQVRIMKENPKELEIVERVREMKAAKREKKIEGHVEQDAIENASEAGPAEAAESGEDMEVVEEGGKEGEEPEKEETEAG